VRRQHEVALDEPLRAMPMALAGTNGIERQMSGEEQRLTAVSDYVFRTFGPDSATAFSLYVGYYQRQATGKSIHSPRNCLPGVGWQTVEAGKAAVAIDGQPVTVNRYLLASGTSQALVYYWYQGRGRVAHNEYTVKWDLLRDAVAHGRSEEALVRLVVPIRRAPGYTTEAWRRRVREAELVAQQAAAEVIPRLDAALPPWEAGRPLAKGSSRADRSPLNHGGQSDTDVARRAAANASYHPASSYGTEDRPRVIGDDAAHALAAQPRRVVRIVDGPAMHRHA
jgi:EpsI family protein